MLPSTHDHLSYPAYDKQIQTAEEGSDEEAGTVEEQQMEIDTSNDDVSDESSSSESRAGNRSQRLTSEREKKCKVYKSTEFP